MTEKLTQFPVPIEILNRAFDSYLHEDDHSKVDLFLRLYIQADDHQKIEQCLELGADPNQILTLTFGEEVYNVYHVKVPILLHAYRFAIEKNDFTIPAMILKYQPDVNLFEQRLSSDEKEEDQIWYNTTNPLFSIIRGSKKIPIETKLEQIQILFDHGADLNLPNHQGWTPLSKVDDKEVYDFLVQKGANINYVKKDKWGAWNRLMIAVFNNNVEEAKWLLEHGIDLDYIGEDDYEGTINGTPHGPVDIFHFLDYINRNSLPHLPHHQVHHQVTDPITEFFDQRERKRIEENPFLDRFPKIIKLKLIGYLLHPRSTLSEDDFN